MNNIFKSPQEVDEQRGTSVFTLFTKGVDGKLRLFATYLSKKTQNIQPRTLATFLLALCLIGALVLCISLFYSFRQGSTIQIQPISSTASKPSPSYSTSTLHRIRNFHRQLDSLKKNNYLRYDSIMKSRPHLLDSIKTVEQLIKF